MSTLTKKSHLRIALLSYNFSWNNDVKQYLWLLNYSDSLLYVLEIFTSVAIGRPVTITTQKVFEAWLEDLLVLNIVKQQQQTHKTLLWSLEKLVSENNSNEITKSQIAVENSLSLYAPFHYSGFLSASKFVSLQTGLLLVYRRLIREEGVATCASRAALPASPSPDLEGPLPGVRRQLRLHTSENFGIFAESNKKEASAAGDISDVYFYPWETITINFILRFAYVIEQLPSGDCFSHYCLGLSPSLQFNISLLIPQLKHSARLCLQVFMPGVKRRGEFLSVSNLFCLFRVLRHNLSAFPFGSNFKPHK